MTPAKDILLDDTGDLYFSGGDIVVGFSDLQHQSHILEAFPGFYRESPLVGVGIEQYVKASGAEGTIKRSITIQLEQDNYKVNTVMVEEITNSNFTIEIDAERIS